MQYIYKKLFLLSSIVIALTCMQVQSFGQGTTCGKSTQLCGAVTKPANTTGADGGTYGCLTTTPKQSWYFVRAGTSGSLNFPVSHSVSGTDVDFAAWGPFNNLATACNSVVPAATYTNQVSCNYTTANGGTVSIPAAVAGEFYVILITNFAGTAGNITVGANTGTGTVTCTPPGQTCVDAQQICSTVSFNANTTGLDGGTYNCLLTTPRQTWLYAVVGTSGSLSFPVSIAPTADIDFAGYGPYTSVAAGCAAITGSTTPLSCNYTTANGGTMTIPSAVAGQVYMFLITNFSGATGLVSVGANTGTGTITCLPPPCSMSSVTIANIGTCNNNGTSASSTDDYYTADITVNYVNKPGTGTLALSGSQIHTAVIAVPVAGLGATSYTFTGVKIKANGTASTITAAFSADALCTATSASQAAVASCSCAAGTMILNVTTP